MECAQRGWECHPFSLRGASVADFTRALVDFSPTHLVHAASVTQGRTDADFLPNAQLADMVLAAAQSIPKAQRPVLVSLGSAGELGAVADQHLPAKEECPPLPISPYGRSKWEQTRKFLSARAAYDQRILCARVFNVSVFTDHSFTIVQGWADRIAAMPEKDNYVLATGDLTPTRDFLSGPWIARILGDLVLSNAADGIVNVASGREISLGAVLDQLSLKFSWKFTRLHDPIFDNPQTPTRVFACPIKMKSWLTQDTSERLARASISELLWI